jgi:hypothetical protein
MKRRAGIFLLCLLTLVLLKLGSMALGWCNLESDVAVLAGFSTIVAILVLSPVIYKKVWTSMINPTKSVSEDTQPSSEA